MLALFEPLRREDAKFPEGWKRERWFLWWLWSEADDFYFRILTTIR